MIKDKKDLLEEIECPVRCKDCHIFAGSSAYVNCEIYIELYENDLDYE